MGILIFSFILRLRSFLGFKFLNFNIFGGGCRKKTIVGGNDDFVDIFGGHHWTSFRGHFYAF